MFFGSFDKTDIIRRETPDGAKLQTSHPIDTDRDLQHLTPL